MGEPPLSYQRIYWIDSVLAGHPQQQASQTQTQTQNPKPNSHLSLLAMVNCWVHLNIQPQHHLTLAATPIFCLRTWLDTALTAALNDTSHHSDDLEFIVAAWGWSWCVRFWSFKLCKERFGETAEFFKLWFEGARRCDGSGYYGGAGEECVSGWVLKSILK